MHTIIVQFGILKPRYERVAFQTRAEAAAFVAGLDAALGEDAFRLLTGGGS